MDVDAPLGNLASAIAVLAAAFGGYRTVLRWYRRTLGSRRDWTRRLNSLACGITRGYAETFLGPPAFRRLLTAAVEYVYVTPHAWVQLLVGEADDLARIAITVTDRRFRFKTSHLTLGHLDLRLGVDPFSMVEPPADGLWACIGARRFGYAESYWGANPGGYQHYVIAFNDASGVGDFDIAGLREAGFQSSCAQGALTPLADDPLDGQFDLASPSAHAFRSKGRPNTLVIVGPNDQQRRLTQPPLGVDLDQVRVLRRT